MTRWARQWPLTPHEFGLALVVLALMALGLGNPQTPSAFGPAAPAVSSQHAHQPTGVVPGQADCPPEAEPVQPRAGGAQTDGAPAPALVEPPVISSQAGVLRATLTVAEQNVQIGNQTVLGRLYNGTFVGPTLRVRPGDLMELTLANCLTETTNLHFHGMHVTPTGFGDDIFRAVDPGEAGGYLVRIPPTQPTGTFWYHSHLHGRVASQVFGGLSGLIIVEGLRDLLPPELRDVPERTIALKDFRVINGVIERVDISIGAPTTRTVNGQLQPQIPIQPGETQLWRIANIGANITYQVKLDGHTFHVLAEDGNPVWAVWEQDELLLPPGKRWDVLIQGGSPAVYVLETVPYDTGPDGNQFPQANLATLVSQGASQPAASLPTTLGPNHDLSATPIAQRREIVFSEDTQTDLYYIDGRAFDHNRVDTTAQFGTVEEWTIRNVSQEQHPFHIHQGGFQVMSVNGVAYNARGQQDTVMLPVGGEVVIRKPFQDFTGKWVYHCHILNHEDAGMMAVIEVVP
jgi:suppressor of ftsI